MERGKPRIVLVTGVAGFIGFHVAKTLAFKSNHRVIGIDIFNDYYDLRLKQDRAYEIFKIGVKVYQGDVCDTLFLEDLFQKYNFTNVIHLAAQAGVRYSVQNPTMYVRENIQCFINLMEVLKNHRSCPLVYASSSSVYGPDSTMPFRESQPLSLPGNVYAASKVANEIQSISYCHKYNISAVGLRFFTVYGPWGRPDMAIYKFANKIMAKEEVPAFTTSNGAPLMRDFTYIDDIVDGVIRSMSYIPQLCNEVFNLGCGHPESVPALIQYLESSLNKQAIMKEEPAPATELLKTYADIRLSTERLGYKPYTSLKDGVKKFIKWFLEYRKTREREDSSGKSRGQDFSNR
ncbi:uncharacterized protein LOC144439441 [Glandiceps talaboti]